MSWCDAVVSGGPEGVDRGQQAAAQAGISVGQIAAGQGCAAVYR